jgi:hypothetical protein
MLVLLLLIMMMIITTCLNSAEPSYRSRIPGPQWGCIAVDIGMLVLLLLCQRINMAIDVYIHNTSMYSCP